MFLANCQVTAIAFSDEGRSLKPIKFIPVWLFIRILITILL
ncbi:MULTISPECIES: hypothetical protein [unclassified Microcoleus]|nr:MULTISPECIES: hypothetical protein [unclassified Microcoleus]